MGLMRQLELDGITESEFSKCRENDEARYESGKLVVLADLLVAHIPDVHPVDNNKKKRRKMRILNARTSKTNNITTTEYIEACLQNIESSLKRLAANNETKVAIVSFICWRASDEYIASSTYETKELEQHN